MSNRAMLIATAVAVAAAAGCDHDWRGETGPGDDPGSDFGPGNGPDDGFGDGQSPGSGPPLGDTCGASVYDAESAPLDMFIMLDTSGSMNEPAGGSTRWGQVSYALQSFVSDAGATGLGVGLGYFPVAGQPTPSQNGCPPDCSSCTCINSTCTCEASSSCDAADYARPVIEIAELPAAAGSIMQSISAHVPVGGTPTGPALAGALDHAKGWAAAHPERKAIVLLATDGEPTSCAPADIYSIAGLASSALASDPRILTFVVGVGNVAGLNQIAAAGGTSQAFVVDGSSNVAQSFLSALQQIRDAALACDYAIPVPQQGEPDFALLNVRFTPDGGAPRYLARVPDASACDPTTGGWYYDNPSRPTRILVCPASCGQLSASLAGKLEILLGCQTIVEPPK